MGALQLSTGVPRILKAFLFFTDNIQNFLFAFSILLLTSHPVSEAMLLTKLFKLSVPGPWQKHRLGFA